MLKGATKPILATLMLSAAAALAPAASAQSYDYLDCKRADKDAQVVGGLIGAAIGGVAGSQIAGRGERTEGSVIGALAGAAAGAGIADDRRNCTREEYATTRPRDRGTYTVPSTTVYGGSDYTGGLVTPVHHRSGHRHRGHDRRRGYDRRYDRGYGNYGFRDRYEVRYEIERLKAEDDRLKRRSRYEYAPWIERRRDEIRREVKRLKRIEDRLKDRRDYRRDDYRRRDYRDYRDVYSDRRGDRRRHHYHGSTVCYADH